MHFYGRAWAMWFGRAAHLEASHTWTAYLMYDPSMQVNPPLEAPAWSRAYEFGV